MSIGDRNPFDTPLDALRFCLWGAGVFALTATLIGGLSNQLWNAPLSVFNWFISDLVRGIGVAAVVLLGPPREPGSVKGSRGVEGAVGIAPPFPLCPAEF